MPSTIVFTTAIIALPVASFAQTTPTRSREQARTELAQLEEAGYNLADTIHYPENLWAAKAKVEAQRYDAQSGVWGYGGGLDGASGSEGGEGHVIPAVR
jgi:Domain of unknown function (DUF4148)